MDSGASHNYIARELVTSLNLPISETREFSVTLGDGSKRASRGLYEGLRVSVGENCLHVNAFILEIGGIDMILGMEWLETLGEVKSDWKKKVMSFQQGNKTIILKRYQVKNHENVIILQEILYKEEKRRPGKLFNLIRQN